jgi:hypothetical protein
MRLSFCKRRNILTGLLGLVVTMAMPCAFVNAQSANANQSESYEALIKRAADLTNVQLGRVTVVDNATVDPLEVLQQAIRLEPGRHEAYEALGFLQLYLVDSKGRRRVTDTKVVEQTMQHALDNGGAARFQVMHIHNTTVAACAGDLSIRKNGVAYEISAIYHTSKDDNFDLEWGKVTEVSFPGSFAMRASGSLALKTADKTYNFYGLNKQAKGIKLTNDEKELMAKFIKH